uniref:hypothetical protein n=1 Tax=Candidatus Electronema sp. TaxID=2698783 RepID=UPI004057A46B
MNMLRAVRAGLLLSAAGLIMTAAPARALDFDPETLQAVDDIITQMQRETMRKQYEAMPLKDELPGKMMNNMYQYASTAYRQNIQPQMVQVIIGNMRPWEFPDRFKTAMMPMMVSQVSANIKQMQLQQMQEGISDPAFPNLPGRTEESGKQQELTFP